MLAYIPAPWILWVIIPDCFKNGMASLLASHRRTNPSKAALIIFGSTPWSLWTFFRLIYKPDFFGSFGIVCCYYAVIGRDQIYIIYPLDRWFTSLNHPLSLSLWFSMANWQFTRGYLYIWVNYNISPTWIKPIWGWFPYKKPWFQGSENSEVVIIYPDIYIYI